MWEKELREFYRERDHSEEDATFAIMEVRAYEEYLKAKGASLEFMSVDDVQEYVSLLISHDKNSMDRLLAIARYCFITKKHDEYIYFTAILGFEEV